MSTQSGAVKTAAYRRRHPDRIRAYKKSQHARDVAAVATRRQRALWTPERKAQERVNFRKKHLKRAYGITVAQFDGMVTAQQGVCAICSRPERIKRCKYLHVDHCHNTGKIRGLLCSSCNLFLGTIHDNPEVAKTMHEYLINGGVTP